MSKDIKRWEKEWIEDTLSRLDMVEWDRFVLGNASRLGGRYINVYGWIDRENDDYKDFVMLQFYPETDDDIVGYTTSSDKYTDEIFRRLYEAEPDDHNPCQRVEHTFDVPNAVELHQQTKLTDGAGRSLRTREGRDGGESP